MGLVIIGIPLKDQVRHKESCPMKKIGCFIFSELLCVLLYAKATEENTHLIDLLIEPQNAIGLVLKVNSSLIPNNLTQSEGRSSLWSLPNNK